MILLNVAGDYPLDSYTVTSHHDWFLRTTFIQIIRVKCNGIFRSQLKNVTNLDCVHDSQFIIALGQGSPASIVRKS